MGKGLKLERLGEVDWVPGGHLPGLWACIQVKRTSRPRQRN